MNTLDGIAVVVGTPIALLIAFGIGSFVRGLLIKDTYKMNLLSVIINSIIGITTIVLIHCATTN